MVRVKIEKVKLFRAKKARVWRLEYPDVSVYCQFCAKERTESDIQTDNCCFCWVSRANIHGIGYNDLGQPCLAQYSEKTGKVLN